MLVTAITPPCTTKHGRIAKYAPILPLSVWQFAELTISLSRHMIWSGRPCSMGSRLRRSRYFTTFGREWNPPAWRVEAPPVVGVIGCRSAEKGVDVAVRIHRM